MAEENSAQQPLSVDMPFEKALEELEQIVARMEQERLPVETLIKAFEQGSRLAVHCRKKLDDLEQRIEILSRKEDGSADWQPF
ncbi:MAG: exodeoxyribonuclease VII small subunit [Lentisphaeria bacterium]|nr:exodeoxyribonuclease VII small subunit [Lentisphaeria bacterium]